MAGSAKQSGVDNEVWIASSLALLAKTLAVYNYSVHPPSMMCATPVVNALSSLER